MSARVGARVGEQPHRRGGESGQVVAAFLRAPDGVDRQRRPREATSAVGDERVLASEGRERAFGHADDVHDVEVTPVGVPYTADEHAGAEAPHAAGRRVQLGFERPHERGQRGLAADLGQCRQAVERVGDLSRRLDLGLGPARAPPFTPEVAVEQVARPGREMGPGARGRRYEARAEIGDEPRELPDVLEVRFVVPARALAELVVAGRFEAGRQVAEKPGQPFGPLSKAGDDARLARQDVPATGRDGAAVGRIAHGPRRDPVDDGVASEVGLREAQEPEEDASRSRVGETARRRTAPRDVRRVEQLVREARVRLVDTEENRNPM